MSRLLEYWVTRQPGGNPQAAPLVLGQERMTYSRLEEITSRRARMLQEVGRMRSEQLCLLISNSQAAVVSLPGILKAERMTVPVDMSSLAPRVAKILELGCSRSKKAVRRRS